MEKNYFISFGILLVTWSDGYDEQEDRSLEQKEEALLSQSILLYNALNYIITANYDTEKALAAVPEEMFGFYENIFQTIESVYSNIDSIFKNEEAKKYVEAYGRMIHSLLDEHFYQKETINLLEKSNFSLKIKQGRVCLENLKKLDYNPAPDTFVHPIFPLLQSFL